MIGVSHRAFIAGLIGWMINMVAAVGEIPAGPPEQQDLVRDWRIAGPLTIRGTLIELKDDAVVIREESGHLESIPFELLSPADLFRVLKWEEERLIFPHLAGLEFQNLILPKDNLPVDEAFAFIWEQARELRPGLSEKPPQVELLGTRTMPVVSLNVTGSVSSVHSMNLLCQWLGVHWTLEDGVITEADWIYTDGIITFGRAAAIRELESFKQRERLLSAHQRLVKLIADATGATVEVDIHVRPR